MSVQIDGDPVFDKPQPFHYVPTDVAPTTLLIKQLLSSKDFRVEPYIPPPKPQVTQPMMTKSGQSSVIAD
jgi:hypothetical protein